MANIKAMMPPITKGRNCIILPEIKEPNPYSKIKKGNTGLFHPITVSLYSIQNKRSPSLSKGD